jgi:hypothetical protein
MGIDQCHSIKGQIKPVTPRKINERFPDGTQAQCKAVSGKTARQRAYARVVEYHIINKGNGLYFVVV